MAAPEDSDTGPESPACATTTNSAATAKPQAHHTGTNSGYSDHQRMYAQYFIAYNEQCRYERDIEKRLARLEFQLAEQGRLLRGECIP
jgi:hypothetical protein